MRALFPSFSGQSNLRGLLAWTTGACVAIFFILQLWRPCYFLTDDNLAAGFPFYTEVGRAMQAGHAPFTSDYLFGGNYNFLRDLDLVQWHPFIMFPALLADTPARFWIVEIPALLFLVLTTVGFTVLAYSLREELSLKIPDAYLIFYTLSFVFSTYTLTIGPSWLNFLGNQSSLPWLALGILDRKVMRGTILVLLFTINELLVAYAPLTVSGGLILTLFAIGVARSRRSVQPLFCWCAGNLLALLILSPLLLAILDGFAHSARIGGFTPSRLSEYSIPVGTFPFSMFLGNWSEPVAMWQGDKTLETLAFPYVTSILACAAAWCLIPALFVPAPWRPLDKVCVVLAGVLCLFIIRPEWLAAIIYHLPFFRSMRWPFREGMLFLFFVHVFLVLRFPQRVPPWQSAIAVISLMAFLLPLPFIRVPSLNARVRDRQLLFSGEAERFWVGVKSQLKPTDEIATVVDWPHWKEYSRQDIPFTLLGTGNFPEFFKVRCISGYSPTAPTDQVPLKTYPGYTFGAFREDQVPLILAERPDLKLLRIGSMSPLKITMSTGAGPAVDLSPYLEPAAVKGPEADPSPSTGR